MISMSLSLDQKGQIFKIEFIVLALLISNAIFDNNDDDMILPSI